ncbi:MAG: FAD-dependent oxidoreductase, partial [Candidatus Freyarchaeota archaeon]
MKHRTDFLVIGSGIAGLSFALKAGNHGEVTVVTKKSSVESSTNYAQGGIAAVMDLEHDNFESHIRDTLEAGAYLNDREVVEIVVREAPERVRELIDIGVEFERRENGSFDLAMEGGHSHRRILHV